MLGVGRWFVGGELMIWDSISDKFGEPTKADEIGTGTLSFSCWRTECPRALKSCGKLAAVLDGLKLRASSAFPVTNVAK
jgi:hypothetical protein